MSVGTTKNVAASANAAPANVAPAKPKVGEVFVTLAKGNETQAMLLERIANADPKFFGTFARKILPQATKYKKENGATMPYSVADPLFSQFAPVKRDGSEYENPTRTFLTRLIGKYGRGKNQLDKPQIVALGKMVLNRMDAASGIVTRTKTDEIRSIDLGATTITALDDLC
jgi:hypothetical protein